MYGFIFSSKTYAEGYNFGDGYVWSGLTRGGQQDKDDGQCVERPAAVHGHLSALMKTQWVERECVGDFIGQHTLIAQCPVVIIFILQKKYIEW